MKFFLLLIPAAFFISLPLVPEFPPPPGTRKAAENLFVDKKPINYLDYYEFLAHIKKNQPGLYPAMIPSDTSLSHEGKVLWKNPEFEEFPVLGLSEVQMDRYCMWRSDAVNLLISNPEIRCASLKYWKKFDRLDPGRQYQVVYSIPSAEDMAAARIKKNQYGIDEWLTNGILKGDTGKEEKAFRCKAAFVKNGL